MEVSCVPHVHLISNLGSTVIHHHWFGFINISVLCIPLAPKSADNCGWLSIWDPTLVMKHVEIWNPRCCHRSSTAAPAFSTGLRSSWLVKNGMDLKARSPNLDHSWHWRCPLPSGRGEKHEPSNNIEQTDQAALRMSEQCSSWGRLWSRASSSRSGFSGFGILVQAVDTSSAYWEASNGSESWMQHCTALFHALWHFCAKIRWHGTLQKWLMSVQRTRNFGLPLVARPRASGSG